MKKIITSENFDSEVVQAESLVLLDFWAPWCAPCKAMSSVLDEIANEYHETLIVGTVCVEDEEALATKFRVMGIPSFILVKDGKEIERAVGSFDKKELLSKLKII